MTERSALFVTTVPVTLEAFLTPLARHFRSQGWRVDGAAREASSVVSLASQFDALHDIDWNRDPLALRNLIGVASRLRRLVADGGYQIVHVHTPVAAFVTRYALRRMRRREGGPKVIYTAHGFHFYRGGSVLTNAVFRGLESIAAHWTDYLVTINDEDFSAALRFGGIPAARVRLIRGIGVDCDIYSPDATDAETVARIRRELDVPPDAFLLTMVAEFAPVKRHAHVLQALSQVSATAVRLVVVGDGPLLQKTREQVDTLGLTHRVTFAGYRRDVPDLLAASDALIIASEREGLNRSALEAMACGKPVIGTDTRGIADAVGDSAGWIVEKNDPSALARAIDEAAADRKEAQLRGRTGRERALQEFDVHRIVSAYDDLYREALQDV